jgi:hypothetical protein
MTKRSVNERIVDDRAPGLAVLGGLPKVDREAGSAVRYDERCVSTVHDSTVKSANTSEML